MTVKPILFSGAMVRAMLDGRKSQTRRVLKPQPSADHHLKLSTIHDGVAIFRNVHTGIRQDVRLPYAPGDLLYVRETWKPHSCYAHLKPRDIPVSNVFYAADNGYAPSNTPWKPNIYCPRWASRLTLEVTDVRGERVQDISEEDARAEGVEKLPGKLALFRSYTDETGAWMDGGKTGWPLAYDSFLTLWNSLNEDRGYGTEVNPWVCALTFKAHQTNVDRLRAA